MLDVIISGANGNMGKLVNNIVQGIEGFDIVALFDPSYILSEVNDIKETDISNLPEADLIIDFCSSSSIFTNCQQWIENYKNIIVGSSGLTRENHSTLASLLNDDQLLWIVPNFSIGSILQKKWSIEASKYYNFASITERHHTKKEDAPSGTSYDLALNLKDMVSNDFNDDENTSIVNNINIESKRDDKYLAEQEIILSDNYETLTIEHVSLSRDSFVKGLVIALDEYKTLSGLNVGLDKVLK